ncbi:GDSL-type esterase/lipase family protein [Kamptonema formosum]|uniref:GDSL-type esterase/lipase family protein n=1 Tax=Kamptonema formosum TaxID=331992 RepID=UPI000348F895|nr:GDSL-type esterase/lipase family protein [Oscillatoria sp. PCC 10802]
MSDPCLLAVSLLTSAQMSACAAPAQPPFLQTVTNRQTVPTAEITAPEFSKHPPQPAALLSQLAIPLPPGASLSPQIYPDSLAYSRTGTRKPVSGAQLYHQRLAALSYGQIYTRLPADSYWSLWANATEQPTYEDWKDLLEQEAGAIARGQGSNLLSILLGDSLSLWFPPTQLPSGRFWLNQGISGDTAGGVLSRLSAFSQTNPHTIYIMAGINDLRRGESDRAILWNFRQILRQLRREHPHSLIVVESILPTRLPDIPNSRIRNLNRQIAAIAYLEGASYLDIYIYFADERGDLRQELTTDGLHLNPFGYAVWQWALQETESWGALNPIQ